MQLKGIDVDFDFLDADDVEKFEVEAKKVIEKTEEYKGKEIALSEEIKIECEIIDQFIDNVFGSNISKEIFGGKKNLKEHISIFQDIMNEKIKYTSEINSMYDRFQPNRATYAYNKRKR